MEKIHHLIGFYPDIKLLILLLALAILSIPDLVRYRIRSYLDECTMDLIAKTKKRKGRR
jgi:hypothetical protein